MNKNEDLFILSARQIAQVIRDKKISPLEVVQIYFDKITSIQVKYNPVCEWMYTQAQQIARRQTEQLQTNTKEELPPLFGVPFSVKEMIAVQGMRRTAGNTHRLKSISSTNATVVDRLISAGAIPLVTTNVPELGFWFESFNTIYGQTKNPYDTTRTAGGSSGGEAALIGAGGSPFGLGSDIGGSIRMPAAFCGVFGHKPTHLTVPLTGHFPYTNESLMELTGPTHPLTDIGVLCRRAEDLALLYKILSGPDGIDPDVLETPSAVSKPLDLNTLKVLICPEPKIHLCQNPTQEVSQCVLSVAQLLASQGARVEDAPKSLFLRAGELWNAAVRSTKKASFEETLTNGEGLFLKKELLKSFQRRSSYSFSSLMVTAFERLLPPTQNQDYTSRFEELNKLKLHLSNLLHGPAILIMPVHPRVAFPHSSSFHTPFDFLMTAIINAIGFPAISCPVGFNKEGLPLAVQIIGAPHQDELLFEVALYLEQTLGGWKPPA